MRAYVVPAGADPRRSCVRWAAAVVAVATTLVVWPAVGDAQSARRTVTAERISPVSTVVPTILRGQAVGAAVQLGDAVAQQYRVAANVPFALDAIAQHDSLATVVHGGRELAPADFRGAPGLHENITVVWRSAQVRADLASVIRALPPNASPGATAH